MPLVLFMLVMLRQAPAAQPDEFVLPSFAPPARPQPRWALLGVEGNALVLGNRTMFVGLEATGFFRVGLGPSTVAALEVLEGWQLDVGPQLVAGWLSGPLCLGTPLCASRFGGGATARVGWARGALEPSTRTARPQTMVYAQLDVLGAGFVIPDAPLAPGVSSAELLVRLRVGGHLSLKGVTLERANPTVNAGLLIEAIPVSRAAVGVSFGGALGLSW